MTLIQADFLEWIQDDFKNKENLVDLTLFSPPYPGKKRKYGELNFQSDGEPYICWLTQVIINAVHFTNGFVVCVLNGSVKDFEYDAVPERIMADIKRKWPFIIVKRPHIYRKNGVPGSGGKYWFRSDYEYCLIFSKYRKPRYCEPLAIGEPPKYKPGGPMSNRKKNDERVNKKEYKGVKLANPGDCFYSPVGGGLIDKTGLAHENEAPFPEKLVERFIKTMTKEGQVVSDIMMGSGTVLAVAQRLGRKYFGIDIRASQVELTKRRLAA